MVAGGGEPSSRVKLGWAMIDLGVCVCARARAAGALAGAISKIDMPQASPGTSGAWASSPSRDRLSSSS